MFVKTCLWSRRGLCEPEFEELSRDSPKSRQNRDNFGPEAGDLTAAHRGPVPPKPGNTRQPLGRLRSTSHPCLGPRQPCPSGQVEAKPCSPRTSPTRPSSFSTRTATNTGASGARGRLSDPARQVGRRWPRTRCPVRCVGRLGAGGAVADPQRARPVPAGQPPRRQDGTRAGTKEIARLKEGRRRRRRRGRPGRRGGGRWRRKGSAAVAGLAHRRVTRVACCFPLRSCRRLRYPRAARSRSHLLARQSGAASPLDRKGGPARHWFDVFLKKRPRILR
jgi:hypothetical protein